MDDFYYLLTDSKKSKFLIRFIFMKNHFHPQNFFRDKILPLQQICFLVKYGVLPQQRLPE